jgi:diaminobutyrate-2-oxoglutarate transaminase
MEVFEKHESEIRGYVRAYPTVFASASNARQVDEEGKSYIDFFGGAGVLNFGHNNPHMKEALIDFIKSDGVAHSLDMATTVKRSFMESFVQTILKPRGMSEYKLQFMGPTGTNAVEASLKLARRVTDRPHVVAFSHGFHGMTLGSLACTANNYFRKAAGVPLSNVDRLAFGDHESLDRYRDMLNDPSSGVLPPAAFIVEPIQAEGGVNIASKEWLHAVQKLAHEFGALFILDDIQAGCGRTGSYFSFDEMGLSPDIVNLAKGIGGFGTPLAMNLVKPEHDKHWSPGEHTGTFRGQGFSFVAGRVALTYFENEDFNNETKAKGKTMRAHLKGIAKKHADHKWEVRGKGMMQAIDIGDGTLSKAMARKCFDNGMLIGPCGTNGQVLKLIPPLTIPEADLDEGLKILSTSIEAALKEAK